MHKLKQAIVVEGRYDKNTLSQIIDAPIFQTNGFGIMKDKEQLALLRLAARTRGLVVLTDSDGAGFVIRNHIKSALQGENILHAYIPDIEGKERRKTAPGKEGKLGVEGMRPEVILQALRNAGAELDGESLRPSADEITRTDLYQVGLSGRENSAALRKKLLADLSLPQHMGANALLQALNMIFTREEFLARMEEETL